GLAYARARLGNGNFDTDPGGIIRRTPYQAQGLKSFAVATVERVTGKPVHPFSNDTRLIDFSGPAGTMPSIPFSRVYLNKFPPGYFRNKIVVVGASAPSLQDVHPVSFGQDEMPGPEIQANAIATVLDGVPLTLVPPWINLLLIIFLGFLCPLASLRLNLLWTLMLAIGAAVAFL